MADHDQAALVRAQEVAQPHDRVGVEVVRRLVEQQRLRVAEQDPGQLDPPALAAGQRAERLGEDALGQPQARADLGRLGLGRVAAGARRTAPAGAAYRRIARSAVSGSALAIWPSVSRSPRTHLVQTAGGQDAVAGQLLEVAGARVLRQVADAARRWSPSPPPAGPPPPGPGSASSCRRRCGRPGRPGRRPRPGTSPRTSSSREPARSSTSVAVITSGYLSGRRRDGRRPQQRPRTAAGQSLRQGAQVGTRLLYGADQGSWR